MTTPPGPRDGGSAHGHDDEVFLQIITGHDGKATTSVDSADMISTLRHLVDHVHTDIAFAFEPGAVTVDMPITDEKQLARVVTIAARMTAQHIRDHLAALVDQIETELIEVVSRPEVAATLAGNHTPPPGPAEDGGPRS